MNKLSSILAVAALTSVSAWAQTAIQTPEEYKAALTRADADYRVAREKCDAQAGTAKAICVAEAKAAEMRAQADADEAYKNTDEARYEANVQRAQADYIVAKERCMEKAGNARDVCVKEAQAQELKARADAKASVTEHTRSDAATTAAPIGSDEAGPALGEREAARQQCDKMNGPARDECIAAAEHPGRQ
jgi:hypothetical protein